MCKAVSDIGMAITKAKLQVFKAGEKIKKVKAKEMKEKIKVEKTMKHKEDVIEKALATETITEPIDSISITQEHDQVEPVSFIKKIDTAKADMTLNKAECVEIIDTATYKGIDKKEKPMAKQETAKPKIKPLNYLESLEQEMGETVQTFQDDFVEKHIGIIKLVQSDLKMVAEVNELMEVINAKEFGPGESPLRELAKIGYMLRKGITTEQIEGLYDSEFFPALRVPQSQSALVQLVERQGHGALITEVLSEETVQDEEVVAAKAGFRAFLKMVEMNHNSVEEVIAHFYPEDFKPCSWVHKEAQEVNIFILL